MANPYDEYETIEDARHPITRNELKALGPNIHTAKITDPARLLGHRVYVDILKYIEQYEEDGQLLGEEWDPELKLYLDTGIISPHNPTDSCTTLTNVSLLIDFSERLDIMQVDDRELYDRYFDVMAEPNLWIKKNCLFLPPTEVFKLETQSLGQLMQPQ